MLNASVKLLRVPFNGDLYKPTEFLYNSVENTLLQQQLLLLLLTTQDEHSCLPHLFPSSVCRQVILKINVFIKCLMINFIFPRSGYAYCPDKGKWKCQKSLACRWVKGSGCVSTKKDGQKKRA